MPLLTECNPFKISRDINSSFGVVSQIQSQGASLKITCVSSNQKEQILQSTRLSDQKLSPRDQTQRDGLNKERLHQDFNRSSSGVPLDIGEEEIKEATGSKQVRHITKRNSVGN